MVNRKNKNKNNTNANATRKKGGGKRRGGRGKGSSRQASELVLSGGGVSANGFVRNPPILKAMSAKSGIMQSRATPSSQTIVKHHKLLCGLVDAFCTHAMGAKYPDGIAQRTVSYRLQKVLPLTCGTASPATGLFWFSPDASRYAYQQIIDNGTTLTTGATFQSIANTADGNFLADCAEIRVVSAACTYTCNLPSSTATNFAMLSNVSGGTSSSNLPLSTVVTPSDQNHGYDPQVLDTRQPWTWYARRADPTQARQLVAEQANNARTGAWEGVLFVFNGPSSNAQVGFVEMVINLEVTISGKSSTVTSMLGTPGQKENTLVQKALGAVATNTAPLITQAKQAASVSFEKHAMDALDSVISEGMSFLGFV